MLRSWRSSRCFSPLVKWILDVLAASVILLLASPIFLLAAIAILLTSGRPVFFRQVRPGHRGQPFTLVKFRTMLVEERAPDGRAFSDEERLGRLGRFLRRTSVDELPQLWNVLSGEMSLVGPRPLLTEYPPRYTPEQARRHDVMSGITGWAQVNGRQDIPFSRRLELDVWYVEHWSLWLDFRILRAPWVESCACPVRPGQEVQEVDDLGLHPHTRAAKERPSDRA